MKCSRGSGAFVFAIFLVAVVSFFGSGFAEDNPSLIVTVFNADGTEKMSDIEVTMADDDDLVEYAEKNTVTTDRNGVARFGPRAFDGFTLKDVDGNRKTFDASARGEKYEGEFQVKVTVFSSNSVPKSYGFNVRVGETMEEEINLGESA